MDIVPVIPYPTSPRVNRNPRKDRVVVAVVLRGRWWLHFTGNRCAARRLKASLVLNLLIAALTMSYFLYPAPLVRLAS